MYKLNDSDNAIDLYEVAYYLLLDNKEIYPELNDDNYHWCWRDELCFIAREASNILLTQKDYSKAEEMLRHTFEIVCDDNNGNTVCLSYNALMYEIYVSMLFEAVHNQAVVAMQENDYNKAQSCFEDACYILSVLPEAGLLDHCLVEYVVSETAKIDSNQAKQYAINYLDYYDSTMRSWCGTVPNITLESIPKSKSYYASSIARIFENYNLLEEAEYFHQHRITILSDSLAYEEELIRAFSSMADFQCFFKADYIESLRYEFKAFNLTCKLYGKDDIHAFDSFYNMRNSYGYSISILSELGIESRLNLYNDSIPWPNITYEICIKLINEWKEIVNNIIINHGETYFKQLINYSEETLSELQSQQFVQDYLIPSSGTLIDCSFNEVIASIYFDKINEYNIYLQTFRELCAPTDPVYLYYINHISYALANQGYPQLQMQLLHDELFNLYRIANLDDMEFLYYYEYYQTRILENSLKYHYYDIASFIINHDLETWGAYVDFVPEHLTPTLYVEKLLAIAWGVEAMYKNYDIMFRLTEIAGRILNENKVDGHKFKEGLVYHYKAQYYYYKQDYLAAEENQIKAINIIDIKDHLMPEWPVILYHTLAEIYLSRDKNDEAIDILNKCIEHCIATNDDRTISYIYSSLMTAYENKGQHREWADAAQNKYLTLITYFMNISFGTNKVKMKYTYDGLYLPILLYSFTKDSFYNPLMVDLTYDVALLQKGFLVNYDRIQFANVQKSEDKELLYKYYDYKNAQMRQSDSTLLYENGFLLKYAEHAEFKHSINFIKWQDVQRQLEKNDLAIEFTMGYKDDSNLYAALLLKGDWESPKIVELCKEDELKKYMAEGSRLYKDNDVAYSMIWDKLEPYFNKGDNIYFAPYGLIHQLNIEVLHGADGKPMNEKCNLYRVSSTGNIVDKRADIEYTSATLYGGLNYDIDTTTLVQVNSRYKHQPHLRGKLLPAINTSARLALGPLEGSADEVQIINEILQNNKVNSVAITGDYGTEESFKTLSGKSPSIIHLSTHGFYLEDIDARKMNMYTKFYQDGNMISPLKRAGLVFSGGQHAWLAREIPEGIDDGILTAEEIAGMNLSDTDLLVLSACQTGLGEITTDSVEGLQQGFKMAGVNTIIMSLWEISDETTGLMMTTFYKSLMKGKTKREAFDIAVEEVKKKTTKMEKSGELGMKYSQHPHLKIAEGHWAAFIMLD